ncbi:endonuclease-reverse transcriptase, partial [Lasius niger]
HSGIWPDDWVESIFVPIYKKGAKTNCSNYKTIALISHASKILLWIINERLKPYIHPQIPEEQAGFMPGKGTRNKS